MNGSTLKRVALGVGFSSFFFCFLLGVPLLAGDWASTSGSPSVSGQGNAYPGTMYDPVPSTSTVSYAENDALDNRVAELEAALAKIQKKEAEAKKKAEGAPSVTAGGRIHLDAAGFNQNTTSYEQIGDQENGVEFRRARLFLKGDAFQILEYKAEYDFADTNEADGVLLQSTAFKDVYIAVKELPLLGHVRAGHFKEPIGLDQLTSSNFISFMERSLPDENGFVPGRNTGVMAYDNWAGENGTWAIGCFVADMTAEPPIFQDDDGGLALSMRGTYLPWYDEATEGRGLWHLGVSYSYRDSANDTVRFRQRPECHLADYIVDTGNIPFAPNWELIGLETATVYGPLSFQAEWFSSFVNRSNADPNLQYNGGYAYVSYFLTGEHRNYKREGGCFDRVTPHENFFRVRGQDDNIYTGKGAWEVLYRYSYLDLSEFVTEANHPGIVHDHTIGLNWYLNPYTRMMFNYVNSTLDNADGVGNMSIFEVRSQIDF
ncbi:MAG TPA: porin [Thermoguttaceae bacterium]|nr:porin [Thermoguttaceae bacterium]